MSDIYVGEVHPAEGDPDNLFTTKALVTGEAAAGSVESTGCKMVWPS
jgi:branched-chain amino acid transport system substrate-binding protein